MISKEKKDSGVVIFFSTVHGFYVIPLIFVPTPGYCSPSDTACK